MWLFSTIRPAEPSPSIDPVGAAEALPRHLLVSLAGITAAIAALQPRCVDAPQVHADLGAILDRVDGLIATIDERAAGPTMLAPQGPRRVVMSTSLPGRSSSHVLVDQGRRQS